MESEKVIFISDLGVKILVNEVSIGKAWNSNDVVIYDWGTSSAYFYKMVVPYKTSPNEDAYLDDLRICFK